MLRARLLVLQFSSMKPSSDRQIARQPASSPTATAGVNGAKFWIKTNGFILGLLAVVGLAFLFPDPGSRNGWMHPELAQKEMGQQDQQQRERIATEQKRI